MTILVSGGGTAGHITPILAVAHELKLLRPNCKVIYVGEREGKFQSLTTDHPDIDEVYTIFAGKFRRYHGESWLHRLVDLPTNLKNLRDMFYVAIGYFQGRRLLKKLKPDAIFLKGGYVGVPIGLAAAKKIPFVTHDSDAFPGIANRLTARWAALHATGMPPEYYNYPKGSMRYTGVLVGQQFKLVDDRLLQSYREDLSLTDDSLVMVITGGSLGAERLNKAVKQTVPQLLTKYPKLIVVHQVGRGKTGLYQEFDDQNRVKELEFLSPMEHYTGAADIVVTRAGANTLAELGVQGKALIVVPNPLLAAGHQLKNADYLAKNEAVLTINESQLKNDSQALLLAIEELLDNPQKRQALGQKLHSLTKPNAAKELAETLIKVAEQQIDV